MNEAVTPEENTSERSTIEEIIICERIWAIEHGFFNFSFMIASWPKDFYANKVFKFLD